MYYDFIFNKRLEDVYDCEGYTTAEVLSYFYDKINDFVERFNELEGTTNERLDYLLGEGLSIEVANKINEMYENGTLSQIINSTLFSELNEKLDNLDNKIGTVGLLASTFGIKADGSDETEKINNFLNEVNNRLEVNKIIFPKGTIIVNNTIDFKNELNRKIEIIGFDTKIKLKDNSYAFNNNKPISRVYGNINFKGFSFDGNIENNYIETEEGRYYSYKNITDGNLPTKGSIALAIMGDNVSISNCKFKNISWSGIDVVRGNNIEIYENEFNNVRQDCIPIHNATNVRAYRNKIKNNGNHGLHAYSNCSNVYIYDNKIELVKSECVNWSPNFINIHEYVALKIDHELYPESKVENVFIYNNIVNGSYGNALEINGYPHYFEVYNNTFNGVNNGIKIATPNIGKAKIYDNKIISDSDCIIFRYFSSVQQPNYYFKKSGELEIIDNNLTSINSSCIGFNLIDNIDYESYSIIIKNNNFSFKTYDINLVNLLNFINLKSYSNFPNKIENTSISKDSFKNAHKLMIRETNDKIENLIVNSEFTIKEETTNKPLLFNNRASLSFNTNVEVISGKRFNVLTLNSTNPTGYNALSYNCKDISFYKTGLYTLSFNIKAESTHTINVKCKLISEDASVIYDNVLLTFTTTTENTNYNAIFRIPNYESIGKLNSTNFELYFQIDNNNSYKNITNFKLYNLSLVRGIVKGEEYKNKYYNKEYLNFLKTN